MKNEFIESLEDDLNTPNALAVVWRTIKSDTLIATEKIALITFFDSLLGLRLVEKATQKMSDTRQTVSQEIPATILELAQKRQHAKSQKQYTEADQYRKDIEASGYQLIDTKDGQVVKKI
jgi:cysteinyl-tRNA synthetase